MYATYEDMISAARAKVDIYNTSLGDSAEGRIDFNAVLSKLKKDGAVSMSGLSKVKYEDLMEAGIPKILAREIVDDIFRKGGTVDGTAAATGSFITERRASQATEEQLLQAYDPKKPTAPAFVELRNRSKGLPFIVFNENGTVNVAVSADLLREVMRNEPARESYMVDKFWVPTYKVGDRPDDLVDEHPLCKGKILHSSDGTDDQGIKWTSLPLDVRQLLRLAVDSGEVRVPPTADEVHDLFERASKDGAFAALSGRYKNASLRFKQLKDQGNLPTLRINRTSAVGASGSRRNDPFHGNATF